MAEMKSENILISFVAALAVSFLFGIIIGGIIGLVVILVLACSLDNKDSLVEYLLGGVLGLIVGGLCAAMFTVALFY